MPWWGIALIVVGSIIVLFILAYSVRGLKKANPDWGIWEFFLFDILETIAEGICVFGDGIGECCGEIGDGLSDFGDGGGFDGGCD